MDKYFGVSGRSVIACLSPMLKMSTFTLLINYVSLITCLLKSKKHLCAVSKVILPMLVRDSKKTSPELLLSGLVSFWSFLLWCSAHKMVSKCQDHCLTHWLSWSLCTPFPTSYFLPGSSGWSWLGHLHPKIKQNHYYPCLLQIPQRWWFSSPSKPLKLWSLKHSLAQKSW